MKTLCLLAQEGVIFENMHFYIKLIFWVVKSASKYKQMVIQIGFLTCFHMEYSKFMDYTYLENYRRKTAQKKDKNAIF